ncbi:MAG: hypothetical protein ABI782_09445 [Anaerolineaceae bacterium]
MATVTTPPTRRRPAAAAVLAALAALAAGAIVLSSCGGSSNEAKPTEIAATAAPSAPAASPSASASASAVATVPAADLKLLKFTPDKGGGGTTVTVTGEGLPANKDAEFMWVTVDGSYDMTATSENIQFNKRVFKEKRISVGKAKTGADGKLSATFATPEDYGEVHDVFLTVDGKDVGRAGFRIMRQVSISPESGPIGTPITINVTGLGWTQFTNTMAVRYDNLPTGIITAVTTRGTTIASIRASGGVGKHVLDIGHGARGLPFLNNQQSGTANIPDWRFTFTVTDAKTMPLDTLEFPDPARLGTNTQAAPITTVSGKPVSSTMKGTFSPASGPILTSTTLNATGAPANADVELFFVSARGNRVNPSGWSLTETSLGKFKAGADGALKATVTIPDDLGGWHVISAVSSGALLAEMPFFVEHSLLEVTPRQVKAGEQFTIHLKGIGWTELDNGVAITYDNANIGFACGFNSNGDATVFLVATGEPGIHLIDLYPMIYQGHGEPPWGYEEPLLSFKVDAPGLSLGYNLPTYRLAIEIVP